MSAGLAEWMIDAKMPTEVEVTGVPRTPFEEPRLGVDFPATAEGTMCHRLVAIGYSLTYCFQSGAIYIGP